MLVERYVRWLERCDEQGDVMAESRSGKEDWQHKDFFAHVYEKESDKVKAKSNNIAGLRSPI